MTGEKTVKVRDVMRKDVAMIDGVATVAEALRMMIEQKTSVLLVRKHDENDELGMVLVSDIARRVVSRDRAPDRVNVYEIMEKPVISVTPDMDIKYCAGLFARHNLMRAPVIDNGEILGIISPVNIVLDGLGSMI